MAEISISTEKGRSVQTFEQGLLNGVAAAIEVAQGDPEGLAAAGLLALVFAEQLALFHRAQSGDEGLGVGRAEIRIGEDRGLGVRERGGVERQPPQVA